MKYILIAVKWGLLFVVVSLLSPTQIGFMQFDISRWQYWAGTAVALLLFEVAYAELKIWRRK